MGSGDRVPRKKNARHDAAIRHVDSSLGEQGSTDLKLRDEDRTHVFEEPMRCASVSQQYTNSTALLTESVPDDTFHVDWSLWF